MNPVERSTPLDPSQQDRSRPTEGGSGQKDHHIKAATEESSKEEGYSKCDMIPQLPKQPESWHEGVNTPQQSEGP